jgi:hypothetical protein
MVRDPSEGRLQDLSVRDEPEIEKGGCAVPGKRHNIALPMETNSS